MQEPEVDVQLWGALESDSESEEESEEEEEEEEADATGLITPGDAYVLFLFRLIRSSPTVSGHCYARV